MRKSKLLDIMDSQIGSGWKAKSGAVSNPKSLFQTGQGKVIFFNPGYEVSDAERIDPPNIPESLFAMQESFDADIQGFVDLSAMGNDQTDRMSAMKTTGKSHMTTKAPTTEIQRALAAERAQHEYWEEWQGVRPGKAVYEDPRAWQNTLLPTAKYGTEGRGYG